MTAHFTADDISSTTDFDTALGQLLLTAQQNGIDFRGAWEYRTNAETSDVEVVITELAK